MGVELWRWQNDVGPSAFYAAAALSDGSLLVAGTEYEESTGYDFVAFKLDTSGDTLWKWKDGSSEDDVIFGAAAGSDGSVVLSGYTWGNWTETNQGEEDYAAVKLDSNGDVVWSLQRGSSGLDKFHSVAVGQDDSAVLGGHGSGDFSLIKVDANGDVLWEWMEGSSGEDVGYGVAMVRDDDSVVLAGWTSGNWSGTNAGEMDFAAVKVNADGQEIWRWQDGTAEDDQITCLVAKEDGSIILGGRTYAFPWVYSGGTAWGLSDIIALSLDANGTQVWGWQGGTVSYEGALDMALGEDGSVIFAGYTFGNWSGVHKGEGDFMAGKLNVTDHSLEPWLWQDGTSRGDVIHAVAPGRSEGSMALVGYTDGSFGTSNIDEFDEGVIVMVTYNPSTIESSRADVRMSSATFETPAPFRLVASTSAPVPTPSPFLKASPTSTPVVESIPAVSASSLPSSSSSSSSTIVIAIVVPTASVLALLVLVLCRRRTKVHLGPRRSKLQVVALMEEIDTPGSASGPMASGGSGVDEVASGQQTALNSSGAQARPGDILDSDDVQVGHRGRLTAAFSQELSVTVASQSQSSIEPTLTPRYDNVKRGSVMGLPSPGAHSEGNMRFGRKNRRGDARAAGAGEDARAFGVGREISEDRSVATTSKSGVSFDENAVLQSYDSKEERSSTLSGGRRSCETLSVNSMGTLTSFDAAEYPSDPTNDQGVHMGRALLETARELAQASMIPAVSEAAAMISVLVRLVTDNKQGDDGADGKLRWCRAIVALLSRATDLLSKGEELPDDVEHVLLEDVRESIDDLVQLIRTYRSKNKMVRVVTSSLFKRRQEELETAINRALSHLQMGLQLHGGHKLHAVGQDVKDALLVQQQRSPQGVASGSADQVKAALRRRRRRQKLGQLEIPEEELLLTDELLGRGGFGSVFIADYNGRNAAAKVLDIEHNLAGLKGSDSNRDVAGDNSRYKTLGPYKNQFQTFMRELDTMTRLHSPYTVNVYGAVTSRSDRLILVMELMSGGDLRTFLRGASGPIEEERARRIAGEVCAGMAFLHDKRTIHGDLKSANVLFDGYGRAKICDFGTSRWAQHTYSSGLLTYTTNKNQHTPMSVPWTAPEVLNEGERSFKSDVYSFGIVIWEVLTRDVPWSNENEILQIYRRVVVNKERPDIPEHVPSDLTDIVRACWVSEPSRRPSFQSILKGMKSNGWKET